MLDVRIYYKDWQKRIADFKEQDLFHHRGITDDLNGNLNGNLNVNLNGIKQ